MENVIAQQLVKMQEEIWEKIRENGLSDIEAATEALHETIGKSTCELMQAILEAADAQIAEARAERKSSGLKVKERGVVRHLSTLLGEIEYRQMYYETTDGENLYLPDHLIGVEPYERASRSLCAKLVNPASETSYGKAIKLGNAQVSRQMVSNKLHSLQEAAAEVKRVEQTPEELHIFADEDHVHLKNGTSLSTRCTFRDMEWSRRCLMIRWKRASTSGMISTP